MSLRAVARLWRVGGTARDASLVIGAEAFSRACGMALTVALARTLSKPDFGRYVLYLSLSAFLAMALDVGLREATVRTFVGKSTTGSTSSETIAASLMLKAGAFALVILIYLGAKLRPASTLPWPDSSAHVVIFGIIGAGGLTAVLSLTTAYQAQSRNVPIAGMSLLYAFLKLALGAWLILARARNVLGVVLIASAASPAAVAAAFAPSIWSTLRSGVRLVRVTHAWALLRFSRWVFVSGLCFVGVERMTVFLLTARGAYSEAGRFGAAFALIAPVSLVTAGLSTVLLPQACALKRREEFRKYILRASGLGAIGATTLILGGLIFARYFGLIFGRGYSDAASVFVVLLCTYSLRLVTVPLSLLFYSIGKPQLLTGLNVVQLAVALPLLLRLLPTMGAMGGAVMFAAVEGLLNTLFVGWHVYRRCWYLPTPGVEALT